MSVSVASVLYYHLHHGFLWMSSSSPPSAKPKGQLAQMLASQSSSSSRLDADQPTQSALAARLLGDERRESDPLAGPNRADQDTPPPPPPPTH